MGKTPKRADPPAPGGDERNSCVRGSSLQERQRESDNSNRQKLSNIQKKVYSNSRKRLKGKSRGFTKSSSPSNTSKESKTQTAEDLPPTQSTMQSESEEPEVTLDMTDKKELCEKNVDDIDNTVTEIVFKDTSTSCTKEEQSDSTTTITIVETKTIEVFEESILTEEDSKSQEEIMEKKEEEIKENGKELEEHEQEREEIQLTLRVEESPIQSQEAVFEGKAKDSNEMEDIISNAKETNESTNEMKTTQTESQTDTESCSVDLVESTTSELPEMISQTSSQQQDMQRKEEKREPSVNYDMAGVSYDSSITLKDVKIHLNDCLKDIKYANVSNGDDGTMNLPRKDMSFGKTLRNISGRHSIKRLRHGSSSDIYNRFSPNRFHSKAALSLSQEIVSDSKILRYTTGLSESFSTNGSAAERKRKLESQDWNVPKKRKTDTESSLLNASMGLLRGLRKPIQVSSSKVSYEIHSDKVNIGDLNDGDDKLLSTHTEGSRKWCVIM